MRGYIKHVDALVRREGNYLCNSHITEAEAYMCVIRCLSAYLRGTNRRQRQDALISVGAFPVYWDRIESEDQYLLSTWQEVDRVDCEAGVDPAKQIPVGRDARVAQIVRSLGEASHNKSVFFVDALRILDALYRSAS